MSISEAAIRVRRATPEDGHLVAALYCEAYTPPSGGDAREHYPFPQFLDGDWVADAVTRPGICWIVAQKGEQVVGSAGALRNIGSAADRVAEVYGIVVNRQFRGQRIGSRLLTELCLELGDDPQFVLLESRTALAAGWRVSRTCGFSPLGFEPFAHATPAGSEAMLMTGRIAQNALTQRSATSSLTVASRALAEEILAKLHVALPQDAARAPARSGTDSKSLVENSTSQNGGTFADGSQISVFRDDVSGPRIAAELAHQELHRSGIVGLRRLEGEDAAGRRYERQYYIALDGRTPLASLLVVLDRVDQRARILEMQSCDGKVQGEILAFVLAALEANAGDKRLSLVVDVCANAEELQRTFEQLGCRPTIYYPSLVAKASGRVDAIQYTRLFNADFEDSLTFATELHWPEALQAVSRVQRIWSQ